MLNPLFNMLSGLLIFFFDLVPDYAFAIAMLTVTVMLALFPFNAKGARSMSAMNRLSPRLQELRVEHRNDRVALNEKTRELLQEHRVSPVGGCMPMLLQMPVLFVMYRVVRGLIHRGAGGAFSPRYISHRSALYRSLAGHRQMRSLGIDLSRSAREVLKFSRLQAVPFLLLVAAVVALAYLQQVMAAKRNPDRAASEASRQVQQITRLMPLTYLLFGFALPAGVNVYLITSSAFRIVQQILIHRIDRSAIDVKSTDTTPVAAPPSGAGGAARAPRPPKQRKKRR